MKVHRPIASHVIFALKIIFEEGYYADRVIERLFKANKQLGARDRRFIAEHIYEIVRWWRLIWAALDVDVPSTSEDQLWRVFGAWLLIQNPDTALPDWAEFRDLEAATLLKTLESAKQNPAVRESVPDWLFELGHQELGERWQDALHAMNKQAPVVVRANTLKTSRDNLMREFKELEILTHLAPETNDGLILNERKNIFTSEIFKLGFFEVQDGASQQIAPLLAVEPGMRVIDACAGAGGKSLHIAALLKNKGKVIAMDIHEKKLIELKRRAARAGVDVIETKVIDSNKVIKRLEASADRVLLDVPCSGLGVLRRNPDAKWKLRLEEIENLHKTQTMILSDYSKMVKPGGRLVYATCSVLPSENEKQVENFLLNHPEWKLIEDKKFWPGENGFDGFYAAALERTK